MTKLLKYQALLLAGLFMLGSPLHSWAQDDDEDERRFEDVETSKMKALSQSTAKALEPVREHLSPEPEEEGGEAPDPRPQAALREVRKLDVEDLPSHEKAEVFNIYGYIYYLMDDLQQAKDYYSRVIDEPEANAPLVLRTMKTLAQLHMMDEEYAQARDYYTDWMSYQEEPSPNDYAMLAIIQYNLENLGKALEDIETAISMREDEGDIGKENWYSIQRSIYYQRGNIERTIDIIKKLIVHYPKNRYWRELGGMYSELERTEERMAAYDIAWLQDGLTSEGQIRGLASMYIAAGAPYQGAEVMMEGIEKGHVEETEDNLQMVGSALYQARSLQEALPWMERAAERSSEGESFGRLAGIYVELQRYEDALRTAREALDRGGLRRPDLVKLQAGNALFQLRRYDEALEMFRSVDAERSQNAKENWIQYVQSEREREEKLRAAGIDLSILNRVD